jgi:hypothetical protein
VNPYRHYNSSVCVHDAAFKFEKFFLLRNRLREYCSANNSSLYKFSVVNSAVGAFTHLECQLCFYFGSSGLCCRGVVISDSLM